MIMKTKKALPQAYVVTELAVWVLDDSQEDIEYLANKLAKAMNSAYMLEAFNNIPAEEDEN